MSNDSMNHIFLNSQNEDELRGLMHRLTELMISFLVKETHEPLHSSLTLPELESLFSENRVAQNGMGADALFSDIVERIVKNSVRTSHPKFLGHMTTALPFFSVIADSIMGLLNQNVVKIETALSASFVEKQTIAWMHRLVFDRHGNYYDQVMHHPSRTLGNVTNGGTLGNVTALMVARERILPHSREHGVYLSMKQMNFDRVVILASQRVHYSIKKAASLLGLGSDHVLTIPVIPKSNKIDLNKLEETLNALDEKTKVLALVGVGGSTETGNIDPLDDMATLAEQHGIWFHVDAAWGGAFLLSPSHRPLLRGIERADSVVVDGHKLLLTSMGHGLCLFRREYDGQALNHHAHYIIRKGSVDLGKTSLEGSRPFSSLKLWATLKLLGRDGYSQIFDHSLNMTQYFAQRVTQDPYFELTSEPETNILTYRFIPENWSQFLATNPNENTLKFAQDWLNELNTRLQKKQRRNGKSFVSRTLLESTGSPHECVVLRVVMVNPLTQREHIREILDEQRQLGCALMTSRWSTLRLAKIPSVSDFFIKK